MATEHLAASALGRDGGWLAETIAGRPVLEGATIMAIFDNREGRITGNAGTNSYTGRFAVTSVGSLEVSDLATTRSYLDVPAGRMQYEQNSLTAPHSADRFSFGDGELVLSRGATPVILYVDS